MDPDYALFAAVVEAGSLSAAGRSLRISAAMVSKRIARLEAKLGVRLLHRTTRKLALSEAGARFHPEVVAILRSIRDAEARVSGQRHVPRGPLRVSAPTSLGRLHVAPKLAAFLAAFPEVELEFSLDDTFVDFMAERVDLAIRIAPAIPESLAAHRLAGSRRILCASPSYLAAHGAPAAIGALGRHRLLAATGQLPWRLTDGTRHIQVAGASCVATNSSEVVRELALAGAGIALRSLWDVVEALDGGRLRQVLAPWEGPHDLGIYAVHPRTPITTPAMDAFVAFLRDIFSQAPWDQPPLAQGARAVS